MQHNCFKAVYLKVCVQYKNVENILNSELCSYKGKYGNILNHYFFRNWNLPSANPCTNKYFVLRRSEMCAETLEFCDEKRHIKDIV